MEFDRGPLKTVLDFDKLKMVTPPRDRGNWRSTFQLNVRSVNGNVRVDVYCNPQEGERLPQKITLNLDPVIISTFLEGARDVMRGDFPARGVNSFDHDRQGDQRSKEVFEQGSISFGKDPSGMFLLSVKHRELGNDAITFHFRPSRYWNVIDHTGQVVGEAECSKAMAAGWLKILQDLLPIAIDQTAAYQRIEKAGKDGKDKTKMSFALFAAKNASFSKGSGGGQSGGGNSNWKGGNQQGGYNKGGSGGSWNNNKSSGGYNNNQSSGGNDSYGAGGNVFAGS